MKHKILDHYRDRKRKAFSDEDWEDDIPKFSLEYQQKMFSKLSTLELRPDQVLNKKEIWDVLISCIEALPNKMRSIYLMRELDEENTETICNSFEITNSNFSVLMHRIRLKLKDCFFSNFISDTSSLD